MSAMFTFIFFRFLFDCWRENAQYLKVTRQNYHTSSQHWQNKTMKKVMAESFPLSSTSTSYSFLLYLMLVHVKCFDKVFVAWRVYTEDRSWKKQQELLTIIEARQRLDQGTEKLHNFRSSMHC